MIDKKEIEKIAKLARLKLKEEEKEGFSKDLSSILDYIEIMKEVDIKGIESQGYACEINNATREDIPLKQSKEVIKSLIDMTPDKESGCVKVKAILN